MNRIKKKLRSQTGASLTFALLLFLVCAVVGSAVLVAGTAASGRMSKIAESDQRYYSVNSAARLLIELLEKDEIRVETAESGSGEANTYYIGEDKITTSTLALEMAKQAMELRKPAEDSDGDDQGGSDPDEQEEDEGTEINLTLTATTETPGEGMLEANLDADIKGKLFSNGDLQLAVSNALPSSESETTADSTKYTITLYLMNVGGASSFKWKLYDIDSKMPSAS